MYESFVFSDWCLPSKGPRLQTWNVQSRNYYVDVDDDDDCYEHDDYDADCIEI